MEGTKVRVWDVQRIGLEERLDARVLDAVGKALWERGDDLRLEG